MISTQVMITFLYLIQKAIVSVSQTTYYQQLLIHIQPSVDLQLPYKISSKAVLI